jgi:hypothetical protein
MTETVNCECGKFEFKFKPEDAGRTLGCKMCGREYIVFLEVDDRDESLYDLTIEPTQELLLE